MFGPTKIEVFADHLSSGFWDENGKNLSTAKFKNALSPELLLALKYWHSTWEFFIAEDKASERYVKEWDQDGAKIVEQMNWHVFNSGMRTALCDYEFVYVENYYNA